MNKLFQRLKHELLGVIPPAVFFFISFQLLAFTRALILEQYGIQVSTFITATIGALIVAKVVLIIDLLPFVNRFPDKPLIWNITWKTVMYLLAALLFRYGEHLFHFMRTYGDIAAANRHLLNEIIWPHFWLVQLWLLVFLLIYCTLSELIRVLGKERMKSIFLGPGKTENM